MLFNRVLKLIRNLFDFQLKEYEGKETAQLVDRYKFLDLYPCSSIELKSIGYNEVSANMKKKY